MNNRLVPENTLNQPSYLVDLPPELQLFICNLLDFESLIALSKTCRLLNNLAQDDVLWWPTLNKSHAKSRHAKALFLSKPDARLPGLTPLLYCQWAVWDAINHDVDEYNKRSKKLKEKTDRALNHLRGQKYGQLNRAYHRGDRLQYIKPSIHGLFNELEKSVIKSERIRQLTKKGFITFPDLMQLSRRQVTTLASVECQTQEEVNQALTLKGKELKKLSNVTMRNFIKEGYLTQEEVKALSNENFQKLNHPFIFDYVHYLKAILISDVLNLHDNQLKILKNPAIHSLIKESLLDIGAALKFSIAHITILEENLSALINKEIAMSDLLSWQLRGQDILGLDLARENVGYNYNFFSPSARLPKVESEDDYSLERLLGW